VRTRRLLEVVVEREEDGLSRRGGTDLVLAEEVEEEGGVKVSERTRTGG